MERLVLLVDLGIIINQVALPLMIFAQPNAKSFVFYDSFFVLE